MRAVTMSQIAVVLGKLPADKVVEVYDFACYLVERANESASRKQASEAFSLMLASESVLRRDWDRPEEDAAWAKL